MHEINQVTGRAILIYIIGLAVVYILIEVVWGATGGLVAGLTFSRDPQAQQRLQTLATKKGLDASHNVTETESAIKGLSPEDRREMEKIAMGPLGRINWFFVTLFVSAVAFGIVGFLGGLFSRSWLLAGAVPLLSFLINNPVVRFSYARDLSLEQKVVVIVFAQFAVTWALAYCGARLGLKWHRQKEQKAEMS